ncbi:transporter substrate-binding domain-containing protein [Duganella qianjiadongensis]|uniref:Transporter substrate-binding domain-containing protein n=1 Tax=Duganella qianjiadongensis TaxID=2692176 RepID=A0ABW9VJ62_9BURK|nr:transporter substrate-binding domain-containing protein [Duganella qianjiadongensis]MYM39327.1 transporter substrate-binding domain-containing protein [Duganella qianjiadongensis]
MSLIRPFRLLASCYLLAAAAHAHEPAVQVLYSERPPYLLPSAEGGPGGLTGAPATRAFKQAGIATRWLKLPTNRQLLTIRDSKLPSCAIGWFRTPERERYARFSRPLYHDKDWTVLAHSSLAEQGAGSLHELMQHKEVRILVKDNYSYGSELDKLLARTNPVLAVSTAPTSKMVQSISMGAADMMFISEEEGSYIMEHHPAQQTRSLRLLHLKDLPHGGERYLMCNKAMPEAYMDRLNNALGSPPAGH